MPEKEEVARGKIIINEIEKGKWPNYIKEAKNTRYPLDLYGASLYYKHDLWSTGGYVSVPGTPTGILMRVTARPDIGESANVVRIYVPSGNFLDSDMMDKICDFADKYGVGMVHALTTSHSIEIPGIPKERIRDFVEDFRSNGFDVGSTGDAFRNTTNCVGKALCEYANIDTMGMRDHFYDRFMDYAKYPMFPHKMKLKISGCPLDCARATQKADIGIIGAWEGAPEVDQKAITNMSSEKLDDIVRSCPTRAIRRTEDGIRIIPEDCIQCMECIRRSDGAIVPGREKRYMIYVGGKLRGKKGPFLSKLLTVVKTEDEAFNLLEKIMNVFADNAARKERIGDLIARIGMKAFLDLVGIEPTPMNIKVPRQDIFYGVSDEERDRIVNDLKMALGGD